MALPLVPAVFIGVALATGKKGVEKGVQAGIDHENAKSLNKDANERVFIAARSLDVERELCEEKLEKLGEAKVTVLTTSMKRFVESFSQIKNIDFKDSVGLDELRNLHVDQQLLAEMQGSVDFATNLAKSTAAGVMGGALAAFGAYSAAGMLATASTGTAIAGLSGVAASNATLAFFGGGSLAAGGLGMAGGTAVLGGLVAGPALWVMGTVMANKEGKNKEEALANAAEASEICERLRAAGVQCSIIRRRASLLYAALAKLDAQFMPLVLRLQRIIEQEGIDYSRYSQASKETVARVASTAVSLKSVVDLPLLDQEGNLTYASQGFFESQMIPLPGAVKTEPNGANKKKVVVRRVRKA